MSQNKMYSDSKGVTHSFDFYEARQNDPKWRNEYLNVLELYNKEIDAYNRKAYLFMVSSLVLSVVLVFLVALISK